MIAQQYLIEIMKIKNDHLQKHLGIRDYFTEEDEQELLSWSESKAQDVLAKMCSFTMIGTAQCCPWCINHHQRCLECSYAKRHGTCSDKKSAYWKICQKLEDPDQTFIDLPGLRDALSELIFKRAAKEPWLLVNIKNKVEDK